MSSLWARYKNEADGTNFIEHEWGLASYVVAEVSIVIDDMYIVPELRRQGYGRKLLAELEEVARSHNKEMLISSVLIAHKDHDISLKAQLAVGFETFSADNGKIWLKRKVENTL